MAKTIATITGTAIRPGVSRNGRWYKPEHVTGAVESARKRLASGEKPMVMLTFHGAGDNSREVAASLTGMTLAEDGGADFEAGFTDTDAGWGIAKLADTSDGKPAHLKNVSIRGFWTGEVRKERGPDGQMVETADGLELDGVDFTKSPGVEGAEIKTFAWASDGQNETTERVFITESVQEAHVTTVSEEVAPTTEGAPAIPDGLREALTGMFAEPAHVLEDGICVTCWPTGTVAEATAPMSKRGQGLTGAGRVWADPGYLKDKKQRYDLSTKDNAKSAWSYINQKDNAAKYTSDQLKRVKGRIKKALKKFGVTITSEAAGWLFNEPAQVSESVLEWEDPETAARRSGSWTISASNGPISLHLSSWCMDPADLKVILSAAAVAAGDTLAALDPDMDGDVDVPGVGDASDTDDDAPDESAPDEGGVTETEPTPAATAATPAAANTETEAAMGAPDTTTEAAGQAPAATPPAIDPATLGAAIGEAFKALGITPPAAAAAPAAPAAAATETTPAAPAAPAAPVAAAPITETQEQRLARLTALADQQVAAAATAEGLQATETDEQIMARLLEERLVPLRQAQAETGGVQRKGLEAGKALETVVNNGKALQEATNADLALTAGKAYGPKGAHA